jgi:NADP-dependent 3-hydroxy acid dehydrogenase YdfG
LESRVFLITGASTGIGAATARAAAGAGHRVGLAARSQDSSTRSAAELGRRRARRGGGRRLDGVGPTSSGWSPERFDAFGGLDVAFANAGFGAARRLARGVAGALAVHGPHERPRAPPTPSGGDPALKDSRGHVLLTGSIAGRRPLPGSLYSATKHRVHAMGEAIRADLNDTGIRTTIIAPGMVETPFFDDKPSIEALQPEDVAAGGHVRDLPAAARRRQRDPRAPDGAADVGGAPGPHPGLRGRPRAVRRRAARRARGRPARPRRARGAPGRGHARADDARAARRAPRAARGAATPRARDAEEGPPRRARPARHGLRRRQRCCDRIWELTGNGLFWPAALLVPTTGLLAAHAAAGPSSAAPGVPGDAGPEAELDSR